MKYKIGYLPGTFDLFHIGHLNIIMKAKQQCEYLICAVSTDELVLKHKNKMPAIPLEERIEIVRAIKYVNLTVVQKNHNKIEAWEQYRFNAIFGGDDLKGSERWCRLERQFREVGVEVVYFPYTKEISSTKLREALSPPRL